MKKEVTAAANKLLEILYLHDIDQAALDDLDLPQKYVALGKLIEDYLVEELRIKLPSNVDYSYYTLTSLGEKQHEAGGFRARRKISALASTFIMIAAMILVTGVAMGLVFLIMELR
jgi:hypothetical protein